MEAPPERLRAALAPHYRLLHPIGSGGMAKVYLAEDLRHHRTVAIKVLDPALAEDLGPDRFLREIGLVAGLNHPHIVPLLDSGAADEFLYFVMPYASGESLRDRLERERQLSIPDALRIAEEIADALAYAHAHGALHRDLKPENVLLQDDHALLTDFGIAGALQGSGGSELTRTGVTLGTPSYMSPEQAAGQRDLDARSDLYSLGCVLYEMLAGQAPFSGPTQESVLRQHMMAEPRPVTQIRPTVSPGLTALILQLLAKTPADRPASAKAVATRLAALRVSPDQGEVVSATQARAARPAGRWRTAAIVLASLVTVAAAVIAGWIEWRPRAVGERIQALAVLPLRNLSGDPGQQYFADGITEELTGALASVPSLRIISRTSSSGFQDQKLGLDEIARRLHVDAVIEGSVTRIGTRVRITAALIRAKTEQRLWGNQYERDVQDVLALQSEVAQAIAQQVRARVDASVKARLAHTRTVNPDAYDAYLQGRFLLNRVDFRDNTKALEYFERAVAIDSTFAQAWAGISDTYYLFADESAAPKDVMPRARDAALTAIRLDPNLAEAHAALATVYGAYDWRLADAEQEYRRAIQLNPSYALAHGNLGLLIGQLGRFEESDQEMRRAIDLNPLSTLLKCYRLWIRWMAGHTDEALAGLKDLERVEPDYSVLHYNLGQIYVSLGQHEEALAEMHKAVGLTENPFGRAMLAYALASAGRRAEARKILEQLESERAHAFVSDYGLACVCVALDDKDRALQYLEKCYENREEDVLLLRVDPKFAVLRSNRRYQDLVERVFGKG